MATVSFTAMLLRIAHNGFWKRTILLTNNSMFHVPVHASSSTTKELQKAFANPQIHNLLRLITYRDPETAHKPRFRKFQRDSIKVLSEKELEAVKTFSSAFTSQRLQMPPVLVARDEGDTCRVIGTDANLQGLLPRNNKLVFTDISLGRTRRNRLIVIREPNGDLRHASAAERERINGVYFPLPGRRLRVPLMFSPEHLESMLERRQFFYILDRACSQFEPDDPQYIRVCHAVYDAINRLAWAPLQTSDTIEPGQVNPLRAFRHSRYFGPLALYMIAHLHNPGPLVYEALSCHHYARLGWLLRLITMLRPQSSFAIAFAQAQPPLSLPPPPEIDASALTSDEAERRMSAADASQVLSCAQLFIEKEPLGDAHKILLQQQLQICREGLSANEDFRISG